MKTLTCAQMGGPCDAQISGNTKEEMIANGMKHMEEQHPDMAKDVKAMAKDDPEMMNWQKKFDAAWSKAKTV